MIFKVCYLINSTFGIQPSFNFLAELRVPFIKIGSGDGDNFLLLKYAAASHVPLVVSTGMIYAVAHHCCHVRN